MAWGLGDNKVCYFVGGVSGFSIKQENVMVVGMRYVVSVTVSNMTQGKLIIPSISPMPEITEDGEYQFLGEAIYTDIIFMPQTYLGSEFDGCISFVAVRDVPLYQIYTSDDVLVYTSDGETGITAYGSHVQYQIDWSSLDDGCYYIQFESQTLTYRTDCFNIQLTHPCTLQLTWNCNENAYGFDYSDLSFTQSMRIEGRLWKPKYRALEKEVYEYSNGDLEITYVSKTKEQILSTGEIPEYMHDALSLALDSDNFFINGIRYVFPDEEVTPIWRNSSDLASIEVTVRQSQNLRNANCG